MYKYMMDNEKDVLPEKNEDALEKVKHEDYAFLMESSSIEYIMERECNVTQIGGLLDEKGYGIAMIKGEIYEQSFKLERNENENTRSIFIVRCDSTLVFLFLFAIEQMCAFSIIYDN